MPKPMKGRSVSVVELMPTDNGSTLTRSLYPPDGRSLINQLMIPAVRKLATRSFEDFVGAVDADWNQRQKPDSLKVDRAAIENEAQSGVSAWAQN